MVVCKTLKSVCSFLLGSSMPRWGQKWFCLLHSATPAVPYDTQLPFLFLPVCPLWLKSHANCKNINHYVLFKPNPLSAAGRPQPGIFWKMWLISDKGYLITLQSCKEIVGTKKKAKYISPLFLLEILDTVSTHHLNTMINWLPESSVGFVVRPEWVSTDIWVTLNH